MFLDARKAFGDKRPRNGNTTPSPVARTTTPEAPPSAATDVGRLFPATGALDDETSLNEDGGAGDKEGI